MDSIEYLFPLVGISGVGVLALAAVAIFQDLRAEQKYGYKQAFVTIVTLVMLVMSVGASVSLISLGLKQTVLLDSRTGANFFNTPPPLYLTSQADTRVEAIAYACDTDCQLTAADREDIAIWKGSYAEWKISENQNTQARRELAGSLSVLLIALPLLFFFGRWMNKGAKSETETHGRTAPLRAVYMYGVAFAGLVVAVVAGAILLNTLLQTTLNVQDSPSSRAFVPVKAETYGVDSLIACGQACDLSEDDLAVADEWKSSYDTKRDEQIANTGGWQRDVATALPIVLVGVVLFWYHFTRIRKETIEPNPPASSIN